ncbi:MAG TPA: DUF192 domain-containing protein [Gemmatimonadaceae bacterium]|nr:DUF192 domain-containing protein [Gemmatimonadaceae bacterium]
MTATRRVALLAIAAAAALGAACSSGDSATGPGDGPDTTGTTPPRAIPVAFGTAGTVKAELATTQAQRDLGLMNRASIAPDSGMLFAWAQDQQFQLVAFYMRNTHFDLSVAFLDASRRVINIADMTHDTETLHFATAPFRYAIEAPLGWFQAHGVAAGATATFTIPAGVTIDP